MRRDEGRETNPKSAQRPNSNQVKSPPKTHLADIRIQIPKPLPQPLIILRIRIKLISSINNPIEALPIRESLQNRAELGGGALEGRIVGRLAGLVGVVRGELLAVSEVGLDGVEEPDEGFLVVLVLLAFDDDLLEAVDVLEGG